MSNLDDEEKNLELALKLSLQEFEEKSKPVTTIPKSETRQVMALFDFEAVEENELTIRTGDMLTVTNDTNEYWFEGFNQNGESGFFPSNFVTFDFHEPVSQSVTVEIDPSLMDKMVELIENSEPTADHNTPEFVDCKKRTQVMEQMIETEITAIDKQLSLLNDLAQNFYTLSLQYSEASKNEHKYNPSDTPCSPNFRPHIKQNVPQPLNMYQNVPQPLNMHQNVPQPLNMYQNVPPFLNMFQKMVDEAQMYSSLQCNGPGVGLPSGPRIPPIFPGVNSNPYYPPFSPQTVLDPQGWSNTQNPPFRELPPRDRYLYGPNLEDYKQPYNTESVPPRNINHVDAARGGYSVSSDNNQRPNIYPKADYY